MSGVVRGKIAEVLGTCHTQGCCHGAIELFDAFIISFRTKKKQYLQKFLLIIWKLILKKFSMFIWQP